MKKSRAGTETNPGTLVFHRTFYPEILFEKTCRNPKCDEKFDVSLLNKPIWFPNSDTPIHFRFRLTSDGDFLTQLIIDVGLSMPCKLTISNTEIVPIMNLSPIYFIGIKSNVRVIYNKPKPSKSFDFDIEAWCPQVLGAKSNPTLRLLIQSFFPANSNRFQFQATAKNKGEFVIKSIRLPVVTKHLCRGSEVRKVLKFDVELFVGGLSYDNELMLSAILLLDDSVYKRVDSILIESNGSDVILEDNLSQTPPNRVIQKFKIQKADHVQNVRLSISYMIIFKSSKDFHITLEIEPVLEHDSPYELKSIMAHDPKYHAVFSFKHCKHEQLILIFSALGCSILVILGCVLIYYRFGPRYVISYPEVTYIVDNSSPLIAY
ncbi:hypothetical protein RF11_08334 [Thelohanellus kitauei]|uniref:Uncharacterized protein n=1 Tax=Thelohanellus kitauei TaxID=669202 RepID=A0A0C2MT53_THEKT|nr:hypothetical protein RF11_08334 [Thelohanellus kitauei]